MSRPLSPGRRRRLTRTVVAAILIALVIAIWRPLLLAFLHGSPLVFLVGLLISTVSAFRDHSALGALMSLWFLLAIVFGVPALLWTGGSLTGRGALTFTSSAAVGAMTVLATCALIDSRDLAIRIPHAAIAQFIGFGIGSLLFAGLEMLGQRTSTLPGWWIVTTTAAAATAGTLILRPPAGSRIESSRR